MLLDILVKKCDECLGKLALRGKKPYALIELHAGLWRSYLRVAERLDCVSSYFNRHVDYDLLSSSTVSFNGRALPYMHVVDVARYLWIHKIIQGKHSAEWTFHGLLNASRTSKDTTHFSALSAFVDVLMAGDKAWQKATGDPIFDKLIVEPYFKNLEISCSGLNQSTELFVGRSIDALKFEQDFCAQAFLDRGQTGYDLTLQVHRLVCKLIVENNAELFMKAFKDFYDAGNLSGAKQIVEQLLFAQSTTGNELIAQLAQFFEKMMSESIKALLSTRLSSDELMCKVLEFLAKLESLQGDVFFDKAQFRQATDKIEKALVASLGESFSRYMDKFLTDSKIDSKHKTDTVSQAVCTPRRSNAIYRFVENFCSQPRGCKRFGQALWTIAS